MELCISVEELRKTLRQMEKCEKDGYHCYLVFRQYLRKPCLYIHRLKFDSVVIRPHLNTTGGTER